MTGKHKTKTAEKKATRLTETTDVSRAGQIPDEEVRQDSSKVEKAARNFKVEG